MRRRVGTLVARLAILGAALVLVGYLLREVDGAEVSQRIETAEPWLLAMACLGLVVRGPLLYLRWSLCLPILGRSFSHPFLLTAHLAAILVNHITPTARLLGGVFRGRYLSRRYLVPFADAYGTVLLDQISHQLVQGLLTWLALAAAAWIAGARRVAVLLLSALALLTSGALLWIRQNRERQGTGMVRWMRRVVARRVDRPGLLLTNTRRVVEICRRGVSNPGLQIRLAALGVTVLLVSAGCQWLVFRSLGYSIGYLQVLAVITVGVAAGVVTGTPGGIATTEAAMIATYVTLGVPEVEATAGTLLFRALHYLVVVGLGVPALLYCELSSSASVRGANHSAAEVDPDAWPPADESRPDPSG